MLWQLYIWGKTPLDALDMRQIGPQNRYGFNGSEGKLDEIGGFHRDEN
jgi:hypothetical protein